MKKLLVFVSFLLFFSSCNKENMNEGVNEDRMVPVRFELSMNSKTRSDFNDLLPNGNIQWGNSKNVEYIYVSIPYKCSYYVQGVGTITLGELLEMKAEIDEPTDKLVFTGEVPSNNLQNARQYHLYYFGNNGQGGEGSNITNYHSSYKNILIGKTISFARQTGDIDDLGNYHLAKIKVKAVPIKDGDGVVQSFELVADELQNINSIAKLDLTGETELVGTAAEFLSFTLLWNTSTKSFDEIIEKAREAKIDVRDNAGRNSYISLLPSDDNVYLECSKGRYEFVDGIGRNQLYIGSSADDIENARPLHWE
jgi:hypothetical protein